ncbi:concanavalin A-like lectin/glucanase domain-containing protein [Rhexocercosporidium sp. MPI-PUGE-AT-0058]|nr:concanavalin A-like lectin/glucanase domain-containing protein [Rhexocercosporidium sp. MPI-PUGE-AT-0058]
MVCITSFLVAAIAVLPVLAAPAVDEPRMIDVIKRDGPATLGWRDSLKALATNCWSQWSEGGIKLSCNNGNGGSYTTSWSGGGGFVCGKGWNSGGVSGTYTPKTGAGYLSLYGWTRNPLIEYYIVESHGELKPGEPWTAKGNFTIDGEGTYQLYQSTRTNKPSIVGTATFQQYWSVRTEMRVGGTISTQKHIDAWSKQGMKLGTQDYFILATEGYTATGESGSSGSSSINVSG